MSYHHGNLREELIVAGLAIVEEEGQVALSLRHVARKAGVSHAAPKRHFESVRHLLAAIATRGFDQLVQQMIGDGEGPARRQLGRVGSSYIRFAYEHTGLFRIMYHAELADREDLPELEAASRRTADYVQQTIELCQEVGVTPKGNPERLAQFAWSTVHGAATLMIDNQIKIHGEFNIEDFIDETLQNLGRGIVITN